MYWRIRKISPDQLVRQYGVHAALAVSLLANLFMLPRMMPSKAVTAEQKVNFERFARIVTSHLLDGTYLTFEQSMTALEKTELGPRLVKRLKRNKLMPATPEEAKAQAREMNDIKLVSSVFIEQVKTAEQPDSNGSLPISIRGRIVSHSAEGVDEKPFAFKYWIGLRRDTKEPILIEMQEMNVQAQ